jgi:nicotinate-nucleotide pyrophosphorylase (carboxylating)
VRRGRGGGSRAAAANSGLPIQVEVDRIDQIEPALAAGAERLLLDNMPPDVLREAVALVAGRVPTERREGCGSTPSGRLPTAE